MRKSPSSRARPLSLFLIVLTVLSAASRAESYRLVTIAGGGLGEGRKATEIAIEVGGVAADAHGLLISDKRRSRLIRVDPRTGSVETIAGNGAAGCETGVGAARSAAVLDGPRGVVIGFDGSVYLANVGCRTYVRLEPRSGSITVVGRREAYDEAFAVDHQGRLLVIDSQQHRVWRLNPKDDTRSVLAGNGTRLPGGAGTFSGDGFDATSAGLNAPNDLAVAGDDSVFIADAGNGRVRRVSSGVIQTVSAVADFEFGGGRSVENPGAPLHVVAGPDAQLLLSDSYRIWHLGPREHRARLIFDLEQAAQGRIRSLWALGKPALAPDGTLFVPDWRRQLVLQIDRQTGSARTVAGGGPRGFGEGVSARQAELREPGALAIDPRSRVLYIAEARARQVRGVSLQNSTIATVVRGHGDLWANPKEPGRIGDGKAASEASLEPVALALDSGGNLHVADGANHRIRRIDRRTNQVSTVAGNGDSKDFGDGGLARKAGFAGPGSIAFDSAGNLFVADVDRIRKISPSGIISRVAGKPGAGRGDGGPATEAAVRPAGIAVDPRGNVYFIEATPYGDTRCVRKIVAKTGIVTTVLGEGAEHHLYRVSGLATDAEGRLYLSGEDQIRRFDPVTGRLTVLGSKYETPGSVADEPKIDAPAALAIDANGDIYFTEYRSQRVRALLHERVPSGQE